MYVLAFIVLSSEAHSVTELPEKAANFKMQVSGGKLPSKTLEHFFRGVSRNAYLLLTSVFQVYYLFFCGCAWALCRARQTP
jgi:hypothetical protein